MIEKLDADELEALVIPALSVGGDFIAIANIGVSDCYFGVSKSRPDLLKELNSALEEINNTVTDYSSSLSAMAATETSLYSKLMVSLLFPDAEIKQYDTQEECLEAVANGKVGATVIPSSKINILNESLLTKSLSFAEMAKRQELVMFTTRGNRRAATIINKAIDQSSDILNGVVLAQNSVSEKKMTLRDVLTEYAGFVVGVSFAIIFVLLLLVYSLLVSRKKQMEALKEAQNANAANIAKTTFLNHMSHDIRTPMNVILGYAQLMEEELKEKELPETKEHLEKLQQSGKLLLSIINNVLDMARIESGKMELDESYGRLEDLRQSVFAVFDAEAKKKKIAFQYTMNVEHEHVLTYVTKVKEIFVNILSNAMKYTPSGGSVTVSLEELPCDEPGYMIVRTRVSDTGIGMSQDYLTRIFEAFTREQNTTKSKIAGTGLGMSIVKKYVDLLGGTIQVESELGKGSTFTVTLKHKIADESSYGKGQIENPETGTEILKGRNILIAEDNDLNAEIAAAILERAGLKTERVENGVQCVNLITKMPAGTYDMILMDIQMPEMDGYEAARVIRQLPDRDKACIPIIAMTANAFEEDRKDAMAAGMNGHMAKPIQVDQLLSMLAEMI